MGLIDYYRYVNYAQAKVSRKTLIDWPIDDLLTQRRSEPNYPKYLEDTPITTYSNLYIPQLLREVVEEGYTLESIVDINSPIYTLQKPETALGTNTVLYDERYGLGEGIPPIYREVTGLSWEFIQGTRAPDIRCIYIPIDNAYREFLKDHLPYLIYWSVDPIEYGYIYPQTNPTPTSIDPWTGIVSMVSNGLEHPLLPNLLFTGRMVEQPDSTCLYEYIDRYNRLYVDVYQPRDLLFPLGLPKPGQLILDVCLRDYIGLYPTSGYYPMVGGFTGYRTNHLYASIPYYLYKRRDGACFLSSSPPHNYAQDYINYVLPSLLRGPNILLGIGEPTSILFINEVIRCGITIAIIDNTCPPDVQLHPRELLNDCNIIDNTWAIRRTGALFNDINLIDDTYFIRGCYRSTLVNCLFNNVNMINQTFMLEDCRECL